MPRGGGSGSPDWLSLGGSAWRIGACLLFALSYSRIGVIRRHLTRQVFSSNVQRSSQHARILQKEGKRIHVFWLSGFIFFGSSNGLFERIKTAIDAQQDEPVGYVMLDFSAVPGLHSSAVLSLIKLRNHCNEHGVTARILGLDRCNATQFSKRRASLGRESRIGCLPAVTKRWNGAKTWF